MATETELKLQLPPEKGTFSPHLLFESLHAQEKTPGLRRRLHSVYFDTADHDLAKRGIALRVRRVGRKRIQTIKAPTSTAVGLQVFKEIEAPIAGDTPDRDHLADQDLRHELDGAGIWPRLQPIFRTEIDRTTWQLPLEGAEIEIAWDRGHIVVGERSSPVHELELELKSGSSSALFQVAERLLEAVPYRIGHETKAARGYALAAGKAALPKKAEPVALLDSDTMASAFEKIVENCMDQLRANEAAILESNDPEAIHQFRVALRRLRAIVGAYREVIDDAVHATWSIDLRWAQRHCGPARDLDVFLSDTLKPLSQHLPGDRAIAAFAQEAEAARSAARRAAVQALDNPRYAAMQLQIFQALSTGSWRKMGAEQLLEQPVHEFVDPLLQGRYKRVRKLGRRWQQLTDPELHRLRIQVKKLRYAVGAFANLFKPKPVRRFNTELSNLQDCLGAVNDSVVGRQLVQQLIAAPAIASSLDPAELERIRGLILGWQIHAIHQKRTALGKIWKDFAESRRFWK